MIAKQATRTNAVSFMPVDPVDWIEREFYIPETNAAIVLEPYQRAVIREALRRDDGGRFIYSTVLWGDLKKSAKSTIAAAIVLWLAWHHPWETCRIVANDLKQANSRTFYYLERALLLNKAFGPHVTTKTYHVGLDNHTSIDAIPVDPKGEAGGGDLVTCFTELWAAKNEAAKTLWTETTLSPLKYGRSLRICETYAGYIGASPILEQLYETGVKGGQPVDVGIPGLELTANSAARMLCLWNTQPRCSWQTPDYYAQEAATLAPNEFQRIHRNEWVSDVDSFVYEEWWDACFGTFPDFGRRPLVAACDAGVSDDCFAIVAGHLIDNILYPRFCHVWHAPPGGKIQYSDALNPNNEETPEGYLRRLKREQHLVFITYDEYQLHDFMTRMEAVLGVACDVFSQGKDRAVADKELYDCIRDGRIVHDGNTDLSEHVKNANRRTDGDKLRIVKRTQSKKIDAAVAMSMMNYVCRNVLIL